MKKILVANRGEIAIRILKTARKMGILTVAVYSDADRAAPHVRMADQAVRIGPGPSSRSYLVGEKIIEAALSTGAEAIHPGYGFLSENAAFAQQVEDAGLIFIGPSPYSIRIMGSKLAAKEAVKKHNIPMVPGTDTAITDPQEALEIAKVTGFPVLIKASAGGGGKGMRIVREEREFKGQMERAISEAKSAFGDGSVFIEKYINSPKHIEIQILADQYGHTIHLFERECSIQRRHQKVVEEAPSSAVDDTLRKAMGEAAVKVAESCKYTGAGTVEFLMDKDKNFYFLEMNTRLQVEHPVTEMITGVDLVEQQIAIARGEHLSIDQDELSINGHAIELRVYAEDPIHDFLPSTGTLTRYQEPSGSGARVDSGYEEGMEVPIFYDPMIAKLITHGSTRSQAIQKMRLAISEFRIEGISTTLSFGQFVCKSDAFISGKFDTHFVENYFSKSAIDEMFKEEREVAALIALREYIRHTKLLKVQKNGHSNWRSRIDSI